MDNKVERKIYEKLEETLSKSYEIKNLVDNLPKLNANTKNFTYGIVVGRMYNSFYYQTRRILGRNPTAEEFGEFLDILNKNQEKILTSLGR